MAVSRALRRLLQIRDLEEEQSRLAAESAQKWLHELENRLQSTCARERRGRDLVEASARTGELTDRQAGTVEVEVARRQGDLLQPHIEAGRRQAALLRTAFLDKRVARRQAETLVETIEAQQAAEADRLSQRMADDWFRGRRYRAQAKDDAE
jgi:hypothetical protein